MARSQNKRAYRRDVKRYENFAGRYEKMRIQAVRDTIHDNFVSWLDESGVNPKRVLDVGCGTGALLRGLAERFPDAELHGVDISPNMIKQAEHKLSEDFQATFVVGPAEQLPYEDGEFDLVVSTICFHHWKSRVEGVGEVHRVLAPGGRFGLVDHFAIGWLKPVFALLRMRNRAHTPEELEAMMARAGLTAGAWELMYSLGRLPYIHAVLADRPAS